MDRLTEVLDQIASWNSKNKKIALLAAYLQTLDDHDLARAVRFLATGPVATESGKKFQIGGATLRQPLPAVTGWDAPTLADCYQAVGDTGETVSLLLRDKTENRPMSLLEAEHYYARLYQARRTVDKVALLEQIYRCHKPLTLKYFVKVITGNLRIGLLARMVEEAVAVATGNPLDAIRKANNRIGDLPSVALAARRGTLEDIEARLFHPMDFMLAKPLDTLGDLEDPTAWTIEDKYDGIRSQLHSDGHRVVIFTRGLEETTAAFPEICEAAKALKGRVALDGEILAWKEGKALPFNVLQQRLARKKVVASHLDEIPVVFLAYDILFYEGRMLVDRPIEERRSILRELIAAAGNPLLQASPATAAESTEQIDRAYHEARERGNEGLILKRNGSAYEAGKRSGTWLKVKRPYATLDVVVTAAETGTGRRAVFLSDYTFAVRSGDGFVNVGKAYSGLTDAEVRELTRIFRASAINRFGRVTLVKPEVVFEVAFDGVQKSPRHKSGYALRFPRILRWRKDKSAAEADDLDRVRELYEASLVSLAIHERREDSGS